MAIACRTRPLRLIILGESRDDARRMLLARAEALGIAGAIDLPGRVDNVFPWLAQAKVFALPSLWEGAPNVLLEAMACGVPVVAAISAGNAGDRSEEHTSELQSLMRISYAVFCLKKKQRNTTTRT